MKMFKRSVLGSFLVIASICTAANAGGPVEAVDEGEPVVVVKQTSSSSLPGGASFSLGGGAAGAVAVAGLAAVLFAVAQSSGSHGSNIQ